MSGGVDSAVALLEARAPATSRSGVTLRLWTDPAGPDGERACCSPAAVVAARETCHALGVPARHARPPRALPARRRRAVRRRLREGRDAEPVRPLQRELPLRGAPRVRRRVGAARLATGHYARLREHRGRLLLARAADAAKDQTYMLARLDPRLLDRLWFPLGERTKEETRARAREAGSPPPAVRRARRRASSPAATTGTSSSATALRRTRGRSSTSRAASSDATRGSGASRRDSVAGSASPPESRSTPSRPTADEHGRRRAPRVARPHGGQRPLRAPLRSRRARRGEAPLPVARRARAGRA